MKASGALYRKERFAHDPFKVDLIANPKVVFANFFETVFLVETDRFGVFAKDAHINLRGFD
jgi:hypothetical protein